jgi:cardiolipin synthase
MIGRHLPNVLTVLRLAAVPWVAWLLRERELPTAAAVVSVAACTDALDGWLARRFGWQSWLGSWLDPIADKVLVMASYLGLALIEPVFVPLAALVLMRDAVIVAGAGAYRALVGPLQAHPTWLGKLTSPAQLSFVVWMLLRLRQEQAPPPEWLAGSLAVGVLTLASGVQYVHEWSRRARRNWPGRNGTP